MPTTHTSGAADLPDALRLADWLQNAVATYPQMSEDEPGGYCQEVDQVMDQAAAELRRLHNESVETHAGYRTEQYWLGWNAALAAGQAVALAVDDKTAGHAMLWRQHCDKLDALVTYCPTCCQGFIAQKEMTRDQIIYECGKTAGRATRPAPPAMDDPGPFLDDEGRAMVGTSHHYTADNIRALVAEYKGLESGAPEAVERYSNSDHRTRAGVLWRVISALADEVPFAPAMDGGDAAHDHISTLIAQHAGILEQNESAYFELCYHRATGWMAWITDKPLCMPPVLNPDRKVLAQGQGDTAEEACADAARATQKESKP